MKFLALPLMAVMLFPLTARAELTEADINGFNDNYIQTYATCDLQKIIPFMDMHYADNYTMQLQLPNGETRQGTRADLKRMATQGVQMMQEINEPGTDCKPEMTVGEMNLSGNNGRVLITQHESMTVPQNGQMVTIEAKTACTHNVRKDGDVVTILQSKCELYQD